MAESRGLARELLYPVIIGVASGAAGPLVSAATAGSIILPRSLPVALGAIAVLWAGWVIVARVAAERRRARQAAHLAIGRSQMIREVPVMTHDHAGVRWRVVQYVDAIGWSNGEPNPGPDDVEVSEPPRCPKCETELGEEQGFWGSWTWSCPSCGFARRRQRDYAFVAVDVLRIVRRRLERGDTR